MLTAGRLQIPGLIANLNRVPERGARAERWAELCGCGFGFEHDRQTLAVFSRFKETCEGIGDTTGRWRNATFCRGATEPSSSLRCVTILSLPAPLDDILMMMLVQAGLPRARDKPCENPSPQAF